MKNYGLDHKGIVSNDDCPFLSVLKDMDIDFAFSKGHCFLIDDVMGWTPEICEFLSKASVKIFDLFSVFCIPDE